MWCKWRAQDVDPRIACFNCSLNEVCFEVHESSGSSSECSSNSVGSICPVIGFSSLFRFCLICFIDSRWRAFWWSSLLWYNSGRMLFTDLVMLMILLFEGISKSVAILIIGRISSKFWQGASSWRWLPLFPYGWIRAQLSTLSSLVLTGYFWLYVFKWGVLMFLILPVSFNSIGSKFALCVLRNCCLDSLEVTLFPLKGSFPGNHCHWRWVSDMPAFLCTKPKLIV